MDRDVWSYLTGHCNVLTFGYCHMAGCVRIGKQHRCIGVEKSQPWCIPLKIYNTLILLESNDDKQSD